MSQLLDKLIDLNNSDEYPMHMPGHKRYTDNKVISSAAAIDITEIVGYDDLYVADGILRQAMDRAARIAHSEETWFLVNGSTVGILTAISAVTNVGDKILVARNCHKSVYHAIELRALEADFIYPDVKNDLCQAVNPVHIEEMLERNGYKAVVITSPTYEGIVSNIEKIAEICHRQKVALIVDEAHGAHFGYHPDFPRSATAYADIVIQSLHKTMPALTQTGLLHINGDVVDKNQVRRFLQMYQTSSPSYVLMASIDECMELVEIKGKDLWKRFFEYRKSFDDCLSGLLHLANIKTDDPGKIIISTKNTSISGHELARILLDKYHIQLEMAAASYVVAIVTCNDTEEGFQRLSKALSEIDSDIKEGRFGVDYSLLYGNRLRACNIAVALRKRTEVELRDSVGSVCADYVSVYPPGIPYIIPGEIITESVVGAIETLVEAGLQVRGICDNQIYVMKR